MDTRLILKVNNRDYLVPEDVNLLEVIKTFRDLREVKESGYGGGRKFTVSEPLAFSVEIVPASAVSIDVQEALAALND